MDAQRNVVFKATPKQDEYVSAVLSGKYRHLLYGGAAGGGKTYILCGLLVLLCRVYPGSRWAIVRADLPRLKKTVIPTWNRVAPKPFFGEINKTDWVVQAENGSEVIFFPASEDVDPTFERVRGIELNGCAFEECDEVSEGFVDVMGSRLGRWKLPGQVQPPILSLYSCNPNQKWPKQRFYEPWTRGTLRANHFYLPAKVTDNPHLSAEYLDQLRDLPEKQRSVYFDGKWEYAGEPDQLITSEWVELAFARGANPDLKGRPKALGVDVARYGDDDTVIAETEGWHLVGLEAWHGIDTRRSSETVKARIVTRQIPAYMVRVDTVGLGAGVADNLRHDRLLVTEFVAGAKPIEGAHKYLRFKNLRSQAWWNMRELLDPSAVGPKASFNPSMKEEHRQKLTADLIAPKYSLDSDKVIDVESKDSIKARLGRSTDYGDACVQAFAKMGGASEYLSMINTR